VLCGIAVSNPSLTDDELRWNYASLYMIALTILRVNHQGVQSMVGAICRMLINLLIEVYSVITVDISSIPAIRTADKHYAITSASMIALSASYEPSSGTYIVPYSLANLL
jgi:hypothetical protein